MADIQLYQNNRLPSLADQFTKADGEPFVIPVGATVQFSMRPIDSETFKIDHAAGVVVSAGQGEVRYDWGATDLDTIGEYIGWWTLIISGQQQDSSDITISVGAHGPTYDLDGPFTWPTREYLEEVSDFDWYGVPQARFAAWSRGARADLMMETGRDAAYFAALVVDNPLTECAREVWQLLMEQRFVKRREDVMESEFDDTYASFTAGSYSESKPSLKDRNPLFARMVNSSPEIARKLWMLMTEDKRDEVRASAGETVPKEYVLEVDWFEDDLGSDPAGWWWD